MQHIDIILFALFVIAVIACAIAMFKWLEFTKNYYNAPEDKSGLYDFIQINNRIINVNRINVIRIIENSIYIELIDNIPIIISCSDNNDVDDIFTQLTMSLDPAEIIADEIQ